MARVIYGNLKLAMKIFALPLPSNLIGMEMVMEIVGVDVGGCDFHMSCTIAHDDGDTL